MIAWRHSLIARACGCARARSVTFSFIQFDPFIKIYTAYGTPVNVNQSISFPVSFCCIFFPFILFMFVFPRAFSLCSPRYLFTLYWNKRNLVWANCSHQCFYVVFVVGLSFYVFQSIGIVIFFSARILRRSGFSRKTNQPQP